jgi:hypothetical protein
VPIRRLCDFADTCVFAKQSLGPILCDPRQLHRQAASPNAGSPSPEVTGTFCRVPSPQITRAPEDSLLAYVCPFTVRSYDILPAEAFLGSLVRHASGFRRSPSASALGYPGLLSPGNAYGLTPGQPSPGHVFTPASPLRVVTHVARFRNVDLIPIAYALRPRLRDRLTRGGRAWPRNP